MRLTPGDVLGELSAVLSRDSRNPLITKLKEPKPSSQFSIVSKNSFHKFHCLKLSLSDPIFC